MNTRKNQGITLVALVITIIILLIIAGISVTGTIRGIDETNESKQISELYMIQHAILERYTKSQLTKEELPGTQIQKNEVQGIIDEINLKTENTITLKGNETDYKELTQLDLENLGIENVTDTYIVNYKTGEVINATTQKTKSGKALYTYSVSDN
jgi:type II secretory pathway pseudopilin PulG